MILVCAEKNVETVLARSNSEDEAEFSGVVLTDRDAEGDSVCGLPVVAALSDAAQYICREWVDEVFLYTDLTGLDALQDEEPESTTKTEEGPEQGTVAALVDACRQMAVPIHIRVPLGGHRGRSFVENVNGFNVVTVAANYASPLQQCACPAGRTDFRPDDPKKVSRSGAIPTGANRPEWQAF